MSHIYDHTVLGKVFKTYFVAKQVKPKYNTVRNPSLHTINKAHAVSASSPDVRDPFIMNSLINLVHCNSDHKFQRDSGRNNDTRPYHVQLCGLRRHTKKYVMFFLMNRCVNSGITPLIQCLSACIQNIFGAQEVKPPCSTQFIAEHHGQDSRRFRR